MKRNKVYDKTRKVLLLLLFIGVLSGCAFDSVTTIRVSVTSNQPGWGTTTGTGMYETGKSVTITASPEPGYTFVGWDDNNHDASRTIITGLENIRYTATFQMISNVSVSVQSSNTSQGTVSGGRASIRPGTSLTISATPRSGYTFVRWNDYDTRATRTITVPVQSITYTAYFEPIPTGSLTAVSTPAAGGITTGSGTYAIGSQATLTATPNSGYRFVRWMDDYSGSSRSVVITQASASYSALYELIPVSSVTVSSSNTSFGTVSGGGTWTRGSMVVVSATPQPLHRFVQWQDGNTESSRTIVVPNTDVTYTATFAPIPTGSIVLTCNDEDYGTVSGAGTYATGSTISIAATPSLGYRFIKWDDDVSQPTRLIPVTSGGTNLQAIFEAIPIQLTVSVHGNTGGTVTGGGSYTYGDAITITATAQSGYRFKEWNDGVITSSRTISISAEARIYAAFFEPISTITVEAHEGTYGQVNGSGTYSVGQQVTISAQPHTGYRFIRWNDSVGEATRTITVGSNDITYTAYFERAVSITVTTSNTSYGTAAGGSLYSAGTEIMLTATPKPGYRFVTWSDGNLNAIRPLVVPESNATYTATFEAIPISITVQANNADYGRVTGTGTYAIHEQATLTATAQPGYRFIRWNDGNTQASRSVAVPLEGATFTAYFSPLATISVQTANTQQGSVSGSGTYVVGEEVTLTALPRTGYRFVRWNDDSVSSTRTITITREGATYTAYFEAVPRVAISLQSSDSTRGSVSGAGSFYEDSTTTIRATALPGYHFLRWNDNNTEETRTLTVPRTPTTYTAYFAENARVAVTVASNSANYGTVTGSGVYLAGSLATLRAIPNTNYRFVRWDDYTTNAAKTITVPSTATTYTAYFEPIPQVSVYVSRNSSSYGTVTGAGTYYVGSSITITATANAGYHFVRWNDNNTNATRVITVPSSSTTYTASFAANPSVNISLLRNNSSYGSVSGGGYHPAGSTTTITAAPYSGYRFVRWNDYNTDATRVITVPSSSTSYTAYFERNSSTTIFSENFDSSSWTSNSTSYAGYWDTSNYNHYRWNRTTTYRYSGSYSAGAQGTRTTYSNNTFSELRRTLYLSGFSTASLSFKRLMNTESGFDYLKVQVVTGSGSTSQLNSYSGSSGGWTSETLSLNAYAGQTVTLVFRFQSDGSNVPSGGAGVWLDDIVVTAQ